MDTAEWFFKKSKEEIVLYNSPYVRVLKDDTVVVIANNKIKKQWLEDVHPEHFDSAMQNENIQISSDLTYISVTCYDKSTWQDDLVI